LAPIEREFLEEQEKNFEIVLDENLILSNPISNSRKTPIYMNEDKSTLQTY